MTISELPPRWRTVRLGYLARTIVPQRDKPHPLIGDIPWLRIEDFDGKYLSTSKSGQGVTPAQVSEMPLRVFPEGTVVCSCSCSMGATAITTRPVVTNQTFIGIVPGDELVPDFLYWLLQAMRDELQSQATGAIQQYLSQDDFNSLRLPLPPLNEQRRIAGFLDDQVARLDRVIDHRSRQLSTLDERALSAISEILAPPARSTSRHLLASWIAEEVGPLIKLGSVCALQSGVTVDASRTEGTEYPYLRVANVQNGSIRLDEVKTIVVPAEVARRSFLRAGDVLMTEGGDIDKLGRGSVWHGEIDPCLHQNHVFALRPDKSVLSPEYLAAMTRTHHARCYFESTGSQSTNLASTNSSKVLAFRFPLPSLDLQQSQLREIRANDESMDRLRSALQNQINLLQERKQALITAAVTGQFDVTTARAVA
jgi:type I restriction enzyme, S subunit